MTAMVENHGSKMQDKVNVGREIRVLLYVDFVSVLKYYNRMLSSTNCHSSCMPKKAISASCFHQRRHSMLDISDTSRIPPSIHRMREIQVTICGPEILGS